MMVLNSTTKEYHGWTQEHVYISVVPNGFCCYLFWAPKGNRIHTNISYLVLEQQFPMPIFWEFARLPDCHLKLSTWYYIYIYIIALHNNDSWRFSSSSLIFTLILPQKKPFKRKKNITRSSPNENISNWGPLKKKNNEKTHNSSKGSKGSQTLYDVSVHPSNFRLSCISRSIDGFSQTDFSDGTPQDGGWVPRNDVATKIVGRKNHKGENMGKLYPPGN